VLNSNIVSLEMQNEIDIYSVKKINYLTT
jgi:hypothetical protein